MIGTGIVIQAAVIDITIVMVQAAVISAMVMILLIVLICLVVLIRAESFVSLKVHLIDIRRE